MAKKPAPKPKSAKAERREALDRMTKAELVRTVLALDARQVKLLNDNQRLQARPTISDAMRDIGGMLSDMEKGKLPNPFAGETVDRLPNNNGMPWERNT